MEILYRALRPEEIDAGGILIPKETTSLRYSPLSRQKIGLFKVYS
jgi:hypothetical protein